MTSDTAHPQETAAAFRPLSFFVRQPQHYPWVVHLMDYHPGLLKAAGDALADMGFRRFRFLGAGGLSLVLETTENQVVRISARDAVGDNGLRPKHPAVLQPIASRRITHGLLPGERHTLILEVLPRVRTWGVTQAHAAMVEGALRKSGLEAEDMFATDTIGRTLRDAAGAPLYRTCNIGLIDVDGQSVPVLIDPGLLRRCRRGAPDDAHLEPWLDAAGRSAQQRYDGRSAPSNIIDGPALRRAERAQRGVKPLAARLGLGADTRRESQLVQAIREDGLYPDQLQALLLRAQERHGDGPGFSRTLEEERRRLRAENEGHARS